jgi:cellulose synthase/poly-beta-1,6-N-acetylglucosamine synthase-like glycosyltransferase
VAFNVYLEREPAFRAYLARLHSLAGDRPLFLAELGLDSHRNGAEAQARSLEWQLRAVFEKGLCGATVYAWTDEWGIFAEHIEGWAFGLTDADRRPKPALETVRRVYGAAPYEARERSWPLVSVVVASYNGGATLDACLLSLARLNYPCYEVIVVDDGSTDDTPAIVARHDVRSLRTENRGLSSARNLGIEAARGEIVAYLDSDARADPDWLRHLVLALEEESAAAVGGPNLLPPEDGFVARCVDLAPGNPTHVLLTDTRAEHVPGCNMAWKKAALQEIGRFDPAHRAAGDDVDVCWKLLVREQVIAFAPSALVWHHRRPTVAGFLRQQRGYGLAEAHLRRRYPGHFNVWGHLMWRGGIYDGVHAALRREGMPALFRPRVYQGWFGGAPFQSLYQPFAIWWFQIFTTVEWQAVALCVLLSGLLGWASAPVAGPALLALGVVMMAMTLSSADAAAANAVAACGWRGRERSQGILLVAALHVLQPLARALGRLRGARAARRSPFRFPAVRRLWGNLPQRDVWLRRLERSLKTCNWVCRPTSPWGEADLDVLGPGPCTLQIRSVHEENLARGEHFVRYRVTARWKPWALLLMGALLLAVPAFFRFPFLLPLAAPLGVLFARLIGARRATTEAVSQLATECGEALGMPVVDEESSVR